ncbi:ATP-binding protein [Pedobacter hartonius]|uniref:histidine kinase n=1 Tax=Pedobacter hartonius TaxID=425514 RepID=A0A1H4GBA4_9SPHI|nr:ATP-binding protein [Pedobacter hartonius]SEB06727.1 His Kinase A (phospho-acceptor) domain-containing protein [Pedobacter hartonius]
MLHPLPQGLNDLYVIINFLVILFAHYYFHGVLYSTLQEKDVLNEELAEVATAKSNFLSMMSHELRTPLNSVIGIASLLADDNHNAQQKEQLQGLKFSAKGLLALVSNILDVNKLDSGKLELEEVPFNLGMLLKGITTGMAYVADEKGLQVLLEVDESIRQKDFAGDPTRLSQVMYNLVGNAIKFTKDGRVTLRAKLTGQSGDVFTIKMDVADTGIGISKSQQDKIFDPFVQASQNTTRKYGGTGLGLSIVKQLVNMFGSEIRVASTTGEGSCFYFDIALREVTVRQREDEKKGTDEAALSGLKILAAEDNVMNIFFMRQLFKRWGIQADIVENGEQVLHALKKQDYDLILMDMHMQVMDGIEATKAIRLLPDPGKANIYIIALTGSVSDNVQTRVLESGMNDYLSKPFQLDDLKSKLLARARC